MEQIQRQETRLDRTGEERKTGKEQTELFLLLVLLYGGEQKKKQDKNKINRQEKLSLLNY